MLAAHKSGAGGAGVLFGINAKVQSTMSNIDMRAVMSKVPAVTLTFWIIKILATTLGETGGDTVTMSWLGETTDHAVPNGYLIGTAIFAAALVVFVILQIVAKKFHPFLYWATIV